LPEHTSLEPSPSAPRRPPRVAAAFLLPLFFVILFPLTFVGAVHEPTPHNLPLVIVGPEQVVADIAARLDATEEFAATHTDDSAEARSSVESRSTDGAIEITVVQSEAVGTDAAATAEPPAATSFTVTTYVASAAGRAVAATVQATGDGIASELGATAVVEDVAPLADTDTLGTSLFYLLVYTSLGAYLVIIVLMQVMPKAKLSVRFAAVTVASVVAPLLTFGLSSIFVGDYDASFGTIVGLLGVNALYVFTVGAAAILIEQFLNAAATFGIMAFVVFLNFPSAGGAAPAALLPPFWQWMHEGYFGAGAFEAFRSIVYFDGNGAMRWILQLLAWAVGLVLVNFVVYLTKTVRSQKRELVSLSAVLAAETAQRKPTEDSTTQEAVRVETLLMHDDLPHERRRPSITTGEGALR